MQASVIYSSPLGPIRICSNGSCLTALNFLGETPENCAELPDAVLNETTRQLEAYFHGALREFNLPIEPAGTAFQRKVWDELVRIPYGKTISYRELSIRLGDPLCIRAAAAANGKNPIGIIIPCHRVIGSNGRLTGYAGGLWRKSKLLSLESAGFRTMGLFGADQCQKSPFHHHHHSIRHQSGRHPGSPGHY